MAALDIADLRRRLERLQGQGLEAADVTGETLALAEGIQRLAMEDTRRGERVLMARMSRLMDDAAGKAFTTAMTDQAFRCRSPRRVADQIRYLLERYGIPGYFNAFERTQLAAFRALAGLVPNLLTPAVMARLRSEMSVVVFPGEPGPLSRRLAARAAEGVRINLNHLGEAILGEDEAEVRVASYIQDISRPDVQCVSVKISSMASQIHLLAREETLEVLSQRMRRLYQAAMAHPHIRPDGSESPKLVYLDMEEYRDLDLTCALFQRVLGEEEFRSCAAGIVLQAYLPDAHPYQRELTRWAQERVAGGGAPIRLRVVKGANLAMEQFEAAHRGWTQAPYGTKAEVDANYKRMVTWACEADRAQAVRLGIASHNLFDLSYGMVIRSLLGVQDLVGFEMLEGMSEPVRRVVQAVSGDLLVYAPMVEKEAVQNAIAYLIRRLDENTSPDNFLRHSFHMIPGSPTWEDQAARFLESHRTMNDVSEGPRRQQDRGGEPEGPDLEDPFRNEADTDWCMERNRQWIGALIAEGQRAEPRQVPLQIGGTEIHEGGAGEVQGRDPSRPGHPLYRFARASWEQVDQALDVAVSAGRAWGARTAEERSRILFEAAQSLRRRRGDLIATMVGDGGKTVDEADVEISEAIDFAEYYRRSLKPLEDLGGVRLEPRNVTVVIPPWNFPLAIPAGGVLAALMAGSAVILKPATETTLVGWALACALWEGGVPRDVLQFVSCPGDPVGSRLVSDPRVDGVILTGGTSTAKNFVGLRPDLRLYAETGGKDSLIVTSMADADLAILDAVGSAFGHAGQKCSACSLLICEAELYDDPTFEARLVDCARSRAVGSTWEAQNLIPPLIHPPGGDLERGLTTLEDGERWALEPQPSADNPCLWTPGIRWDVREGSYAHTTEFFGPVLSVMRADNLEHALRLANATDYGLTAGIHSLDEREKAHWLERIEAGNCYMNRPITGAIVNRQPFGGWKASSFGPGAKAGGPNYVAQLMEAVEDGLPSEEGPPERRAVEATRQVRPRLSEAGQERLDRALMSQGTWWRDHFTREHDETRIPGEDNLFRYRRCRAMLLRLGPGADPTDAGLVVAACATAGVPLQVSASPELAAETPWPEVLSALGATIEGADPLCDRLSGDLTERLRCLGQPETAVRARANDAGIPFLDQPPVAQGRLELLRVTREQSVSHAYHRYGNLGDREALGFDSRETGS